MRLSDLAVAFNRPSPDVRRVHQVPKGAMHLSHLSVRPQRGTDRGYDVPKPYMSNMIVCCEASNIWGTTPRMQKWSDQKVRRK